MSRFYAEEEAYRVADTAPHRTRCGEYRVRLCRTVDRATVAEWRQTQPDILLEPLAVMEAAHTVFSLEYANAVEDCEEEPIDRSLLPPPGACLSDWAPRQLPAAIMPIVWYLIGRIEQAWGVPVGLVFHHGGITSLADQEHALSDLLLGCLGHGVTLADDYSEHLSKAETALKRPFDPSPIDTDGEPLRRLAEAAVERARKQQKRTKA